MIRRQILFPALIIAEIVVLLLLVVVSRFSVARAERMLNKWELRFPDPCWYFGGPWIEPIHYAEIVMRRVRS